MRTIRRSATPPLPLIETYRRQLPLSIRALWPCSALSRHEREAEAAGDESDPGGWLGEVPKEIIGSDRIRSRSSAPREIDTYSVAVNGVHSRRVNILISRSCSCYVRWFFSTGGDGVSGDGCAARSVNPPTENRRRGQANVWLQSGRPNEMRGGAGWWEKYSSPVILLLLFLEKERCRSHRVRGPELGRKDRIVSCSGSGSKEEEDWVSPHPPSAGRAGRWQVADPTIDAC